MSFRDRSDVCEIVVGGAGIALAAHDPRQGAAAEYTGQQEIQLY
jgi:hypothetical protein